MTGSTPMDPFERELRAALHEVLDGASGPHPDWLDAPAARRLATESGTTRRPWRGMRLLAIAAVLGTVGIGALLLAGRPETNPTAGCLTLADYAATSAAPSKAPEVVFPSVAPTASATTGLVPVGSWIVVSDAEGPVYQMRVRDVRPCDRLPTVRSVYPGGSLVLAGFDAQVLRRGLDAWIGPDLVMTVEFGSTAPNTRPLEQRFDVPGIVRRSSLNPPAGFTHSTLIVVDVPPIDASVQLRATDAGGGFLFDGPGWRIREGEADYDPGSFAEPIIDFPRPGPTTTNGDGVIGEASTIELDDGVMTAIVSEVEEVPRYPDFVPPEGEVVIEMRVRGAAWDDTVDPATEWPSLVLDDVEWVLTDATGSRRRNLGDEPVPAGVLQGLSPSAWSEGLLAFTVPAEGPLRLALHRDGVEIAGWSLRD